MDKFQNANFASKFELFFNELLSAFNRCEYTKVIDDIEEKKNYFTNKSNLWLINDLVLSCYNKIVRKYYAKIRIHSQNSFYYIKKSSDILSLMKSGITEWKSEITEDIKHHAIGSTSTLITILNQHSFKLDKNIFKIYSSINHTITYQRNRLYLHTLNYFYLQSLIFRFQSNHNEIVFILILAIKFFIDISAHDESIKNFFSNSHNESSFISNDAIHSNLRFLIENSKFIPEVYSTLGEIFLMVSSILIARKDYATALEYQDLTLRCSIRELNFRYFENSEFNRFNVAQSNHEKYNSMKLCTLASAGLYHRGICFECMNVGENQLLKSVESYKQSKWLSSKYVSKYNPYLCYFFEEVLKKCVEIYQELYGKNKKLPAKKPLKKQNILQFKNDNTFYDTLKLKNATRYLEIIKNIKKMKFLEPEETPYQLAKTFEENQILEEDFINKPVKPPNKNEREHHNKPKILMSNYKLVSLLLSRHNRKFFIHNMAKSKKIHLFKFSKSFQDKVSKEVAYKNLKRNMRRRKKAIINNRRIHHSVVTSSLASISNDSSLISKKTKLVTVPIFKANAKSSLDITALKVDHKSRISLQASSSQIKMKIEQVKLAISASNTDKCNSTRITKRMDSVRKSRNHDQLNQSSSRLLKLRNAPNINTFKLNSNKNDRPKTSLTLTNNFTTQQNTESNEKKEGTKTFRFEKKTNPSITISNSNTSDSRLPNLTNTASKGQDIRSLMNEGCISHKPSLKSQQNKVLFIPQNSTMTSLEFNKKFKEKLGYLRDFEDKELKFHKNYLNIKAEEYFIKMEFDNNKIKKDCENFFNFKLKQNQSALKKVEAKAESKCIYIRNREVENQRQKLETVTTHSLNSKVFSVYQKFVQTNKSLAKGKESKLIGKNIHFKKAVETKDQEIVNIDQRIKSIAKTLNLAQ